MNLRTHPVRAAAAVGAVIAAGTTTFLALSAGSASADEPGRCTQNVNVRQEPDATSRIVAMCDAGTRVTLGEERDGFVKLDSLGGWASKDFVKPDEGGAGSGSAGSRAADADDASDDHASDDRASDDRAPGDRGSDERGSDERASDDAGSGDRGTDRATGDARDAHRGAGGSGGSGGAESADDHADDPQNGTHRSSSGTPAVHRPAPLTGHGLFG